MNEQAEALQERTLRFALRTAKFLRTLPDDRESRHIADQLFRSSTGTASNYRAACRGRSHRDFTAKLGVAHEESDESVFWLVFISRGGYASGNELAYLLGESGELLAILTASVKTANKRQQRQKNRKSEDNPE
jgi:four helix bundle protein